MSLTSRRLRVSLGVGRGISNLARHKFVDHVRVQVLGGGGGKGIIAFESLDNVKQRPVGGHGGRGGDIIIEASRTVRDLNFQTFVIRGHDGGMATGNGKNGKAGKPKKVVVPLGTVVREVFRTYDYAAGEGTDDDPALAEDAVSSLNRGSSASGLLPALSGGSANTWESSDDEEALPSVVTLEADDEATELSVDAADDSGTSGQRTGRKSSPRMRLRASSDYNLAEDDAFSDEIDVEDDWGGPAAVASAVSASAASAASSEAKGRSASRDTTRERISKSGIPFSETNVTLVDLNTHGQQLVVATGGSPGVGNRGSQLFYAAQVRGHDKPHISGRPGQVRTLDLELKSIADVGLVGFPNAGKSSFLGAVSKSKPKVAAYPFTTLHPNIGVVNFHDAYTFTLADIPGIITGAHEDRGLGHEFLRHIERTRVLVYVIDSSGFGGDPVSDLRALQHELQLFDTALPLRPSMVVANKCDLPRAAEGVEKLRRATNLPVVAVSAMMGSNVGTAIQSLRWLLEAQEKMAPH